MLDPKLKLEFLNNARKNLQSKIYDISIEIKVYERQMALAPDNDGKLAAAQTLINNCKVNQKFWIDKLDIVEDEINANSKLVDKLDRKGAGI